MKALPDNQRKNSALPLLNAFARPAAPLPGSHMPAEKFRTAVQAAQIGSSNDVPHLTEALIDKYVSDLQQLGLLEPAAGAHVAWRPIQFASDHLTRLANIASVSCDNTPPKQYSGS